MKAGILTIYDTENLGNRLQNYALQQALLRYADEVVTVKNKQDSGSRLKNRKRASRLSESVLLASLLKQPRKAKFLKFDKQHIRYTRNCYWYNRNPASLKPEDRCDLYCAGSDQIWNPLLERSSMFNYLGFAEAESTFSYAASFGIDQIPEHFESSIRQGLQHIRHLSVREEEGRQLIQSISGRSDAQVLIDPTMLLTPEEWNSVSLAPDHPVPQKYLLTYFLGNVSTRRRQNIRETAAALGCEVVELMAPNSPFHLTGPAEFLYLIRHAQLVCTDSFHGSVFSFLYQRPLVIFSRDGDTQKMGGRIRTFVDTFGLQTCLAKQDSMPAVPDKADYSEGYAVLAERRKTAHAFLQQVFAGETASV